MDINNGPLSFNAVINTSDLDKMTKVVESKIIGMASNIEKESSKMGESFNSGMSSITKEVEKQKEIISSLEDQYNKIKSTLDNTSFQPGSEEQYLKARQLLLEVNTELQEQRENLGFIEAAQKKVAQSTESNAQSVREVSRAAKEASKEISIMYDMPTTANQFKESINAQKSAIINLETEITKTRDAINNLKPNKNWGDNQAKYDILIQKSGLLRNELKDEKKALSELERGYNKLVSEQDKAGKSQDQVSKQSQTYMSQLRKIREEMIGLELQGKKDSSRYRELQVELERTGTAYRRVQQEQKYLTTAGNAMISGLLSGMSAVSGTFSAGSGVVSLFVTDNAKLVAIQTKLQAAMAITIGLQQVSTALHSTSAFRMNVTTKVTNLYSASVLRLGTSFIKMGVSAGVARVAAQALMATLTLGLSVAITGVIYLISKLSSEQSKARAEITKFNESVASSANGLRTDFEKLRKEWELTGEDLKKKEKLVLKNQEAYDKLGVSITSVEDADKLFRDNAEAFKESIELRAKAAAAMDIAAEKYKDAIQKMLDAETRVDNPSFWDKTKGYMSWVGLQQSGMGSDHSWDDMTKEWAKKGAAEDKAEADKKEKEAVNLITKSLGWTSDSNEKVKEAGQKSKEEIKDFSKKYWQEIQKFNQKRMDEAIPNSKAFNEARKKRDEATKKLQAWDKTPTKSANQLATLAQKKIEADQWLLNKQKVLSNEQIKAELESEQKALDLQKESYDKRIKQNELNYRKELQSIEDFQANKEKAQQEAAKKIYTSEHEGNDKGFDFSKFDMSKLPKGLRPEDIKEQVAKLATEVQAAWENADMLAYEEMTKEFMSFQQQKADVTKTYQDLITQYESMGLSDRVALIKKERDQTLGELSAMEIQTSDLWKNLFQNMDNLSEKTIIDIIAKLRELVNEVEDLDIKQALTKQLEESTKKIESKNPFMKLTNGIKDYKKATNKVEKSKALESIGESVKSLSVIVTESLESIAKGLKDLGLLDEATEKTLNNVIGLIDGIGNAADGIARLAVGDITAIPNAISGVVGIITNTFSLFDSKSRDIERKIKAHKKQLIELGRVYKDIEYKVNNAVGEDYYSEQLKAIENLKQQQREVEGLLYQENRKKKKNRNDDAINNYKDQLAEIPRQIQDIEREITEMLVHTSFKDLSNQLADVLVSAFEAGEDAAKDFDKTFNKVIANAVRNSLKMRILEPVINKFTDSLSKYMQGNKNSAVGFDFEKWRDILKGAGESFTSGLEEFGKYFDTINNTIDPLAGAVKSITEETASVLAGQLTMMRINQSMISDFIKNQLYMAILKIANNSEYNKHLESIDITLKEMKSDKMSNNLRAKGL